MDEKHYRKLCIRLLFCCVFTGVLTIVLILSPLERFSPFLTIGSPPHCNMTIFSKVGGIGVGAAACLTSGAEVWKTMKRMRKIDRRTKS